MDTSVILRSAGSFEARVALDDDLGVRGLSLTGMAPVPDRLRQAVRRGVLEGRSRLGRLQMLNANTFPLDTVAGAAGTQDAPAELPVREDVTVRLAQGIGVAVAPSTWLGAYTVWWVADADTPYAGPATFRAAGRSHTTPITTMRSFVSATSTQHSGARILVAALPYAVARQWTSGPTLDVSFSCGPLALTVQVDRRGPVRDLRVAAFPRPSRFARAAVLELPWESRTVSTLGMTFTVNNHPVQPTGCLIEDHVTVDVPRTGMLNQELLDGPGFGASTSPTIQCLNFYWLSPRRTFDPAGFSAISGDADALPLAYGRQRVFGSIPGLELLDAQVNTLHVPLKALAERLGRRDLVLGAARELRV